METEWTVSDSELLQEQKQSTQRYVDLWVWVWFNIVLDSDTVQVISDMIFPARIMTGAKHSVFSTNHLAVMTKINITTTKNNRKPKQPCHKNIHVRTN